jgi:very-short-patch-repair endonuclease
MSNKLEYVARSLSKGTTKKYETYVVNSIYNKLNNFELEIVTQQHVVTKLKETKYIDLYFPQLKIAVEVDEFYHNNGQQILRDNERVSNIKDAVMNTTIIGDSEIQFIRIKVYDSFDLEKLDKQISDCVELIKEKIKNYEATYGQLKWIYSMNDRLNQIKERRKIIIGDSFESMVDILSLFGKKVNGWQRCTFNTEKGLIWSPTLSFDGKSDRNGWVNTISKDLTEIYEAGVENSTHRKTQSGVDWDKQNCSTRIVFLKYKDAFGISFRRFIGVYKVDRLDKDLCGRDAEVWKKVSDYLDL